jgi:hypothetical protein
MAVSDTGSPTHVSRSSPRIPHEFRSNPRLVPSMPNRSTNSTVWYGRQFVEDIGYRQDQISGGTVGPEGSVVTLLGCVFAFALINFRFPETRYKVGQYERCWWLWTFIRWSLLGQYTVITVRRVAKANAAMGELSATWKLLFAGSVDELCGYSWK